MAQKKKKSVIAAVPIYAVFAPIVMIVLAIVGISVFFRVHTVKVVGSTMYTEEEILETANIDTGKVLYLTATDAAKDRIYDAYPYIFSVDITKEIPDTITIRVNESKAIAYITAERKEWLIDENGKILGEVEKNGRKNYIHVTGLTVIEPQIGKAIVVDKEQSTHLEALVNMLKAIKQADVISSVKNLDVSNISNATFKYDGRFDVSFGAAVDTEYKIAKMINVAAQIDPEKTGKLDLSKGSDVRFIPG